MRLGKNPVCPVCVRNHTQTHIHIHTITSHTKAGPARGRFKRATCPRVCPGSPRCLFTGKKTPVKRRRGAGTHGTHGTPGTHGRTRAHGSHGRTSVLKTIHPNAKPNDTPARPRDADGRNRDRLSTSTAARTAAGPESTAPRGRLRRGRPQRTRPCLHPLPERLPAPARRRSAK